ncbi:MAG: RNA polymerase sigma factor [Patescibacteria group bacterium]
MPTTPTDEELVVRVQAGELFVFRELIERYEAKMLRYARKFLLDAEECQDCVQDVFIKAYTNLRSVDPDRKFSSWLYRVAHNEFINAIKKKGRERVVSLDFDTLLPQLAGNIEDPEDAMHRTQVRQQIEKHLAELDVKYREPLVLYYFQELDYKEIAEILRLPVATVGVRLRRAREKLKSYIQNPEHLV